MGKRSPQESILNTRHQYLEFVGRDSIYGYLAENRYRLFRDEQFADLYSRDKGRPSVAPSLAILILFLRAYEGLSFVEAIDRTKYDLRWKVALGLAMEEEPIQKSALQEFEAKLVLHEKAEEILKISIDQARRAGYLENRKIRVALDTTPILGKGAVKDTYNLLADGIKMLIATLAQVSQQQIEEYAKQHEFSKYLEGSIKGQADIDWTNQKEKNEFLSQIVSDGRRLLILAGQTAKNHPEMADSISRASSLLERLIDQDVEEQPDGNHQIKKGTAKDRLISVNDPEMRHGRKSASNLFAGHKAAIAVDLDTQMITSVEIIAGNAADKECAMKSVQQSERVTEAKVETAIGDCAYSSGTTRREFQDAGIDLKAKVPNPTNGGYFTKQEFHIDLDKMEVRCPAGKVTSNHRFDGKDQRFTFSMNDCRPCPLRNQCIKGNRHPRSIAIQAEEKLLQKARQFNQTPEGKTILRQRVVAEHALARLVILGIRKSRYFGRTKTCFQVVMAAVVANIHLLAHFCKKRAREAVVAFYPSAEMSLAAGKVSQSV